jgi:hypothetical protein
MKRALALTTFALALVAPALACAEEAQDTKDTQETQEGDARKRYPPSSVRPRLIVGGLAVTGLGYGAALLTASLAPELPGIDAMKIPVAGPWISLVQMECPADDPDCGFTLYLRGFLTIADGLMQLGGLGIVGEGIFMTTEASAPESRKQPAFVIRPAPIITGTVTGIGVVGRF